MIPTRVFTNADAHRAFMRLSRFIHLRNEFTQHHDKLTLLVPDSPRYIRLVDICIVDAILECRRYLPADTVDYYVSKIDRSSN